MYKVEKIVLVGDNQRVGRELLLEAGLTGLPVVSGRSAANIDLDELRPVSVLAIWGLDTGLCVARMVLRCVARGIMPVIDGRTIRSNEDDHFGYGDHGVWLRRLEEVEQGILDEAPKFDWSKVAVLS